MRLIDVDALMGEVESVLLMYSQFNHWLAKDLYNRMMFAIRTAPTVDAEPVRHGKWEDGAYENSKKCLTCGKYASKIYKGNDPVFDYIICPYCGAKMDGE